MPFCLSFCLRFRAGLALLLLTAVAAALRWIAIGEPLWLDELHTAWTVAGSWSDVAPRALEGNQSPFYFLLIYPLGGGSDDVQWRLRLPSLLASVGLVPLMFVTVRQFTGQNAAGLLAAALVAIDRDCLFFAHEARPYAWVQLVGLGHILQFARLLSDPRGGRRVLFVAGGILLFYLHYTAVLLVVVELAAYGLLALRSGTRPAYRPAALAGDVAAIGLGCAPMIPHLLEIAARRSQWRPYVSSPGPIELLRQFRSDVTMLLPAAVVAWLAAMEGLGRHAAWWPFNRRPDAARRLHSPRPSATTLILSWALLPRLLAAAATYAQLAPLALSRYIIVSAVAPIAFAALCWSIIASSRVRILLAVALLGLMVYRGGLVTQFRHDRRLVGDRQEDWRGAVRHINRVAADGAPVFLCSGLLEDATLRDPENGRADYCRFPVSGPIALRGDLDARPLPTLGEDRLTADDQRALLEAGGGWWIVRGGSSLVESIRHDLRRQLSSGRRAVRITDCEQFGGRLTVLRAAVESRPPPEPRAEQAKEAE